MVIQLELWIIITLILGYIGSMAAMIVYLRIEVARVKEWKVSFETRFHEYKEHSDKKNEETNTSIKAFEYEQKEMRNLFSAQLFELNGKITESATIIKMKFNHE